MKAIFTYTLKRLLPQILGWGLSLAFYCAIVLSFFHIVLENANEIQKLLSSLPKAITSLAGDLSKITTIEGFMNFRIFMIFPILLGMFGIISGSGLIVRDEERGCLDLFMGYPIKRSHMFFGRFAALIVALCLILLFISVGIDIGLSMTDVTIRAWDVIPALVSLWAVLFFFICCSLMFSLILSSRMAAMMVTGLFMLVAQMISSLANISASLKPVAIISPFEYYQGIDAIKSFHWEDFLILVIVGFSFAIFALLRFLKRDIRVAGEGEFRWKRFAITIVLVLTIFVYTLISLTRDVSFLSPQNCFKTVNKAIEEKDWQVVCKGLTDEAKENWVAEGILRVTFILFDIGDDGIVRMLQNPEMRPRQDLDFDRDKVMGSIIKLQIALAGVNTNKLQRHIDVVAEYPSKLYLTKEEVKKLASCVEDKDTFIQAAMNAIADFADIQKYKDIYNFDINDSKATAILSSLDQKITFLKKKNKWHATLPIVDIIVRQNLDSLAETEESDEYVLYKNVVYDREYDLKLDAYIPKSDSPTPAVILIHGGGWRTGDKSQLSRYANILCSQKIACFSINYRLAPEHIFPAQIEDCTKALRWIRQQTKKYNLISEKIGAMGYSAGGHLAALLATMGSSNKDTQLQVAVAGGAPVNFVALSHKVTVLASVFGEMPPSQNSYRRASPETYVSKTTCPIGFFHGQQDSFVSLEGPLSPRNLYEKLKKEKIETEFLIIPNMGHLEVVNSAQAIQFTQVFLKKYLLDKGRENK